MILGPHRLVVRDNLTDHYQQRVPVDDLAFPESDRSRRGVVVAPVMIPGRVGHHHRRKGTGSRAPSPRAGRRCSPSTEVGAISPLDGFDHFRICFVNQGRKLPADGLLPFGQRTNVGRVWMGRPSDYLADSTYCLSSEAVVLNWCGRWPPGRRVRRPWTVPVARPRAGPEGPSPACRHPGVQTWSKTRDECVYHRFPRTPPPAAKTLPRRPVRLASRPRSSGGRGRELHARVRLLDART